MVNEPGSVSSLYVASPRDVVPFPTGAPSRKQSTVEKIPQASAGSSDRPGFSALMAQARDQGEQRAQVASQLRQFQSNLQNADDLLSQIKERLVHIVKQYPPFASDDPQRLAYLNAITGLRKQLDALEFPPEQSTTEVASQGKGNGVELPTLPANPLKQDTPIPGLDTASASDEEVQSALQAIRQMQDKVHEAQGKLWQDVVDFVGGPNPGQDAESNAQAQAGEIRGYVASDSSKGMGLSLSAILSIGL